MLHTLVNSSSKCNFSVSVKEDWNTTQINRIYWIECNPDMPTLTYVNFWAACGLERDYMTHSEGIT